MVSKLPLRALALAAVTVWAAAACGGGDDGSNTSAVSCTDPSTCSTGGAAAGTGGAAASGTCNNGVLDPGEACDGSLFGGKNCATATMNAQPNGLLTCSATCTLVTTGCSVSGVGNGGAGGGGPGTAGASGAGGAPAGG